MAGTGDPYGRAIVEELRAMRKAIEALNPNKKFEEQKRLNGYLRAAAVANAANEETIPVKLDWTKPAPLRADARVINHDTGFTEIRIDIYGEDATIVQDLLRQMNVEALQLSVVEPE